MTDRGWRWKTSGTRLPRGVTPGRQPSDGTHELVRRELHGEVGPVGDAVVFTQRDYRERLYSSPACMTFLRSLFATRTVLFIGVSFTDAHLNELRSEVLAMLDHDGDDEPVAYAILSDVQPHQVRYLRSHEGPGAITFDTAEGTDWSGFEAILRTIHETANPRAQLGQAIADRTILWVDPESDDTVDGASMAPTWSCSTGRWARQCSRQCEPRTSHRVRPLSEGRGSAPSSTGTGRD